MHSICVAGWGPEDHPDFIHFFFDIGNDERLDKRREPTPPA